MVDRKNTNIRIRGSFSRALQILALTLAATMANAETRFDAIGDCGEAVALLTQDIEKLGLQAMNEAKPMPMVKHFEYSGYMRGFVTGYNMAMASAAGRVLDIVSLDALIAQIEVECKKTPDASFMDAFMEALSVLGEWKPDPARDQD